MAKVTVEHCLTTHEYELCAACRFALRAIAFIRSLSGDQFYSELRKYETIVRCGYRCEMRSCKVFSPVRQGRPRLEVYHEDTPSRQHPLVSRARSSRTLYPSHGTSASHRAVSCLCIPDKWPYKLRFDCIAIKTKNKEFEKPNNLRKAF